MDEPDSLILLPGLGADARMFSSLQSELPQLVTPAWIEPLRRESLVDYSRRLAKVVDPGRSCFVGGASLGGVVALEIAAVLPNVRACFVIGSMRSVGSRPWRVKLLHPVTPLVGMLPTMSPWLVRLLGGWLRSPTRGVMTQLGDADARFLKWAARAILTWQPSPEIARVRVCQIHGERDRVFPVHMARPDHVVSGAGHLLSITHPQPVVEFLRDRMAAIAGESP
ncbi:MAG: alpha/beta hydrolase [Candidatus Saccharimonas sp.]|nr:alpha/beta hydrolase [Planctomycetaceae bacterium]